jgi:hypothetical protein
MSFVAAGAVSVKLSAEPIIAKVVKTKIKAIAFDGLAVWRSPASH